MKSKKIRMLLLSLISIMVIFTLTTKTKAATPLTTPVYFGVEEFRSGTTPENMGYAINNPLGNGSTVESIVGTKIWNIKKYSSNVVDENGIDGNFYCIRAGIGFQNTAEVATYNITYDLKTEQSALIASGNAALQS